MAVFPPDLTAGLCQPGRTALPADAWNEASTPQAGKARQACRRCPVLAPCAAWAVASWPKPGHGIIGGMRPAERRDARLAADGAAGAAAGAAAAGAVRRGALRQIGRTPLRDRVVAALLAGPARSNRVIAAGARTDHMTVLRVRHELEDAGLIAACRASPAARSYPVRSASPAAEKVLLADPARPNRAIAAEAGVSYPVVLRVRHQLEAAGIIGVHRALPPGPSPPRSRGPGGQFISRHSPTRPESPTAHLDVDSAFDLARLTCENKVHNLLRGGSPSGSIELQPRPGHPSLEPVRYRPHREAVMDEFEHELEELDQQQQEVRERRTRAALEAYAEFDGGAGDDEMAGDLIADLMHFAHQADDDGDDGDGWENVEAVVERAWMHFLAETVGEFDPGCYRQLRQQASTPREAALLATALPRAEAVLLQHLHAVPDAGDDGAPGYPS